MEKTESKAKRFMPLLLTVGLVVFDQLTKLWVIRNIPVGTLYKEICGDLIWIVHVRNTGAAFSMGATSSDFMRMVLFVILPIAMMAALVVAVVSKKEIFTNAQRWFAAGIAGGGIGTVIDRVFRFDTGVVDFVSVKFFGLFGMDRWPTFNVSDSCVVVFVILLAVSMLFGPAARKERKK